MELKLGAELNEMVSRTPLYGTLRSLYNQGNLSQDTIIVFCI